MRLSVSVLALGAVILSGCGGSSGGSDSSGDPGADTRYSANIRYTDYGVPHITAGDYGSLGYGIGYDHAQNNLCTLSEQLVKLKGEKSRYFGAGEGSGNLLTDVGYKALDYPAQARELFSSLSDQSRELLTGYAAGFNRSLSERQGPDDYPTPCRGAEWVDSISAEDLLAYQLDLAGLASSRNFLSAMAAAQPPQSIAPLLQVELDPTQVLTSEGIGSNGWALGKDRVEGASSLLLGNPHFPWDGELRFYQNHLTIPGELDVTGVTMIGLPAVVIGFNEHLGWTHTVSQSKRFTLYQLTLDENDPTRYLYDGEYRDMTRKMVTVEVKRPDGSLVEHTQPVYFSHFGPMVNLGSMSPTLGWSKNSAITFRDANAGNTRMLDQWLAMGKADSRQAFVGSFGQHQGIPWVNTLMIDKEGTANYIDATQVPRLSPAAEQYWRAASQSPQLAPLWQDGAGSVLLPGDSSDFAWVDTGLTKTPGLVPFAEAPRQTRTDYLFNANSSHWLSNADNPLEGYSILYGPEKTIRSTRTRYNAQLISDNSGSGLAGADSRFSLDELKTVMTHNGSLFGGDWKNQLTQRCTNYSSVNLDGSPFDLTAACQALVNWDGTYNTGSTGAHLMREFLAAFRVSGHRSLDDALFATGFDAAMPVVTPSGLVPIDAADSQNDPVLMALAAAAQRLGDAGVALDAPLGSVQYVLKAEGQQALPISGGYSFEGVFNMAETTTSSRSTSDLANTLTGAPVPGSLLFALDENGNGSDELAYRINYGSSFVMALEYSDEGPRADMFLSYSQGHDPEGEHFSDQTTLYSDLQWRPVLFSEDEVAAAVVRTIDLEE
ncbi:penicillin acylase family protein [Marinobacter daepoensis]|uniref:Penicillin acylase family protein n=1 Tax=Marinobacter daepoensis TaxID=262077 RepID=A0ABS3BFX5_9GAMM|nr:penicillin acylase family protein [Marinobacter daepoensis]MBN7770730.1 penicillin acylase family protein [Marinobacter daepoensis]MBY6078591.1 penicillin acylase family protein [Marinobacter daepoensis]